MLHVISGHYFPPTLPHTHMCLTPADGRTPEASLQGSRGGSADVVSEAFTTCMLYSSIPFPAVYM